MIQRLTEDDEASFPVRFPFLELPCEIREMIYFYAALGTVDRQHSYNQLICRPTMERTTLNAAAITQPTIFRLCRSIREESLGFWYREHEFTFYAERGDKTLLRIKAWMWRVGYGIMIQVRHMHIKLSDSFNVKHASDQINSVFNLLQARTRLVFTATFFDHISLPYWCWYYRELVRKLPESEVVRSQHASDFPVPYYKVPATDSHSASPLPALLAPLDWRNVVVNHNKRTNPAFVMDRYEAVIQHGNSNPEDDEDGWTDTC